MAAETRKSRKSNFSQEEIDVLITTVLQNHNILYGETSKSFFHKEIRNQVWNIILEEVNKVSLERRTLNEVKNKWKKCQYNLRAADHAETVDYVDCDDLANPINKVPNNPQPIEMKSKKHRNRSRNVPNPIARGFSSGYEPAFKKSVILYAEQKSNSEARKRYGISEETIRRWRKLRREIMEMAQQCVRRSQRHAYTAPSASSSQAINESSPTKKDKDKGGEESGERDSSKTDLDSMPLQQRLSQNHNEQPPSTPNQEPVLQSQPISPTKLKVTRQGAKPQQPLAKPPTPPPPNPEVCLRWNSHHNNMQAAFPSLLTKEQYVDATLVSEGKTLKCHRMILSSCSPYFEEVLEGIGPFQHPVLFMKDVPFWILKALCDFMYAGEVHIFQDKLQELLNVAEALKIKGLAGNSDAKEDLKPVIPEIKQEIEATPPLKLPEKPLKEEKEEEAPQASKPAKHEMVRPSKKREDKKSKHSGQMPKEKDKVGEEPPPKMVPKMTPKVVLPKVAPKVVPKVVLPKVQPTSKTTVKNVMKNVLQKVPKPSTSKATHASRKSDASRKSEKHKADGAAQKEKEKEREKPPLKKDNINDPLDLLQPVYEEIAKEEPHPMVKSISPAKLKERGGNVPVRKGTNKKLKKRKHAEEREESPPPVFSSRKGTRSRPHVKIPKFFHTHYEETQKETVDATIVREPHTDQSDPLIGLEEVEEIKAEPLDVEENTIELEENLENYMQDQEMTCQEGEEIIGNYDSPIVNIKREVIKRNTPNIFKKILDSQPVIMNIHTVTEGSQSGVRLLNINEQNLKIVDISKISTNLMEDTIVGTNIFDGLDNSQEKTSEIMISNVQSMAEICEDSRLKGSEVPTEGAAEVPRGSEERLQSNDNLTLEGRNLAGPEPDPLHPAEPSSRLTNDPESETGLMEANQFALRIKVENVRSENSQDGVEPQKSPASSLGVQEQGSGGTLGSLKDKLGAFGIDNRASATERGGQTCEDGRAVQNDIGHATNQEPVSWTNEADRAEQTQQIGGESEGMMSVDSVEGGRFKPGAYEAGCSTENPHGLEKIGKTVEESDVANERLVVCVVGMQETAAYEEMQKRADSAPGGAAQEDSYSIDVLQQSGQENLAVDGNPESYTEPISNNVGPLQTAAGEREEMMSLGTVSQEMMSIGTQSQERDLEVGEKQAFQGVAEETQAGSLNYIEEPVRGTGGESEEMMSIGAGSQERALESIEGELSRRIAKEIHQSSFGNDVPANQDTFQNYREIETVRDGQEANFTARESGEPYEECHQRPNFQSEEINNARFNERESGEPYEECHQRPNFQSEEINNARFNSRESGVPYEECHQRPNFQSEEINNARFNARESGQPYKEYHQRPNFQSEEINNARFTARESGEPYQEYHQRPNFQSEEINNARFTAQESGQPYKEYHQRPNFQSEEINNARFTARESGEPYEKSHQRTNFQSEEIYNARFTARESREPYEECHQRTNFQSAEINNEDHNARIVASEEGLVTRGSEVTEYREDLQNTPEQMSIGNDSQNTEPNTGEAALTVLESEVPEVVRNSETETVNNGCEAMEHSGITQAESSVVKSREEAGDNIAESEENVKEATENIGAELEECLASTSNIAPTKSSEEKSKRLPFEEDDFTKDIEFDNFTGRNRPANYLEDDFTDDFEMEDVEAAKSQDVLGESESRKGGSEDGESFGDNKGEGKEKEAESRTNAVEQGSGSLGSLEDKLGAFGIDNRALASKSGGQTCEDGRADEAVSDRGLVDGVGPAESDSKEAESENVGDSLVRKEEVDSREESVSVDDGQNVREVSDNREIDEHAEIHQTIPDSGKNIKDPQPTAEDEQQLEDSLLADLDDDIDMKEASSSEDGAEKTLEMIVNDLNKSLGELKK